MESENDMERRGLRRNAEPRINSLKGDEPDELFGTNRAPNAIEAVLHALGACLAVGVAYHAAAREIIINAMELDVTGELDTRVFARQAGNRHRRGRSYG